MGLFDRFRRPTVSAADAIRLVSEGATLLDVRENSEWNAGHAPGAIHIPAGQVAAQAQRRLPKAKQVIVVCRSGSRARGATNALRAMDIEALNLRGGMRAWEAAGGRVVGKRNLPGIVA
jgi:rhodanese-related sulfurtransferase